MSHSRARGTIFLAAAALLAAGEGKASPPSSQRSSGRVVTDADSSPEKVVGLEERRSKRSAVVRLASAPLLDVADEPLSP